MNTRTRTTLDRAFDDNDPALPSMSDLDIGEALAGVGPTPAYIELLERFRPGEAWEDLMRELYSDTRYELKGLGAGLNPTDRFRR